MTGLINIRLKSGQKVVFLAKYKVSIIKDKSVHCYLNIYCLKCGIILHILEVGLLVNSYWLLGPTSLGGAELRRARWTAVPCEA